MSLSELSLNRRQRVAVVKKVADSRLFYSRTLGNQQPRSADGAAQKPSVPPGLSVELLFSLSLLLDGTPKEVIYSLPNIYYSAKTVRVSS